MSEFSRALPKDPQVQINGEQLPFTKGLIAGIFRSKENLRGGRPAITFGLEDASLKWHGTMRPYMLEGGTTETFFEKYDPWEAANPKKSMQDYLKEKMVAKLTAAGITTLPPDNVYQVQEIPSLASNFITLADANDLGRALLALGMPPEQVNQVYDHVEHATSHPPRPPEGERLNKAYQKLGELMERVMPDGMVPVFTQEAREADYTSLYLRDTSKELSTDLRENANVLKFTKELMEIGKKEKLPLSYFPGMPGVVIGTTVHVVETGKKQDALIYLAEHLLQVNIGKNGLRKEDVEAAMLEVREAQREARAHGRSAV